MLTKLLQKKFSGNFLFDGIILMFINFLLLFSFGIIFGFFLLVKIILSKYNMRLPFSSLTFIVLFAIISIYIWFVFGRELRNILKNNKLTKVLIINLIGSAPIILVFIYENLLVGLRETRGSRGCVDGLIVFSMIALGSMIFQFISLVGGIYCGVLRGDRLNT